VNRVQCISELFAVRLLISVGFEYAGAQFSFQCFCSNDYNKYGRTKESDCNKQCDGNEAQICGGPWRNSIYSIEGGPGGLQPLIL